MSDTPNSSPEVRLSKSKKWISHSEVKAAKAIAAQLNETAKRPSVIIQLIIFRMGLEFAETILQETLGIEAQGGMMLPNGSRRRTPGGVFFHLAKQRLPPDTRKEIFPNFGHQRRSNA